MRGAILANIGLEDPEESLVTMLSSRPSIHRGGSGEARRRFFGEVGGSGLEVRISGAGVPRRHVEESDGVGVETEGTGLSEDLVDGERLAGGARPLPKYSFGCADISMLCLTSGELPLSLCADEAGLVTESVEVVGIAGEGLVGLADASVCLTLKVLSMPGVGDA